MIGGNALQRSLTEPSSSDDLEDSDAMPDHPNKATDSALAGISRFGLDRSQLAQIHLETALATFGIQMGKTNSEGGAR